MKKRKKGVQGNKLTRVSRVKSPREAEKVDKKRVKRD